MQRGVAWYLVAPLIALALVGCRIFDYEEREPWRAEAEEQCLAQRLIEPSALMEPAKPVNGKGACGMTKPFKVAAVSGGFVALEPKATLACPLVANVEAWFHEAIQPAAMAWYGSPVSEIKQISAYSCRTMNGQPGASISEHAFGNALDVASFRFADGREVDFKSGWKGRPEERGFLRAVHAAACERFSTVLAPGSNAFHYDHIHVDLARRASGRNVCNPAPMTLPAPPPRYPQDIPVARAPGQYPAAQNLPQQASQPSTSPWAQSAPRSAQRPTQAVRGPMVVEREQPMRAALGEPLVLGGQAPSTQSFGAPLPLAERVRQSLGTSAGVPQPMPTAQPTYSNPYGLVPPGRIPNASLGSDPTVTGSIGIGKKSNAKNNVPQIDANLLSPRTLSEQVPKSEPATVFNLLSGTHGN